MPELPEVEVVRRGLADHVVGRVVERVMVRHPRAVRRHHLGATDFELRLVGSRITAVCRRGKYLWLPLTDSPVRGNAKADGPVAHKPATREVLSEALVVHLGMSGQLLVRPRGSTPTSHTRVVVSFADLGPEVFFDDQRTFGGMVLDALVPATVGVAEVIPQSVAHIARDPLDPRFDRMEVVQAMRRRRTELKRVLLDQTVVSGIGNIYADEALWRARLHGACDPRQITQAASEEVLAAAEDVMREALRAGGTSFDSLYVNVNGASGYFSRSLAVYGQLGRPCRRCGALIRRDSFMNRSSYTCPECQPKPRMDGR
ncbi:MAG: bifunctional DNA-formamidopyrimidine glycosylase/DNA-(apurinic or apyrimidinic site) lyase [Actinomycetota bacterium]